MRNKIKEIMNKEEGFTLVELLAVIVILGIIAAIAIPAVGRVITRADEEAKEAEVSLIVDAARLYYTSEKSTDDKKVMDPVTVDELLKLGYIEERADGEVQKGSVKRTENGANKGTYTYEFTPEQSPEDKEIN